MVIRHTFSILRAIRPVACLAATRAGESRATIWLGRGGRLSFLFLSSVLLSFSLLLTLPRQLLCGQASQITKRELTYACQCPAALVDWNIHPRQPILLEPSDSKKVL
ncbi:hypothetical protein BO71DRAFT_159555 [Aspergillus ellipticus CBS 707.79]|uniref:Uncharacterized protein n=1 Tax=Aspergillus ellipticus CBS 707.79 TaxID=1448320 RepID=A0A319DIK7_9EURO|nr:hypothetical protein BO71DRAFT_159555 [Aspergillus ellipticus CBS 707.79]